MSNDLRILHVIDSGGLYGAEKVVLSLMEEHQRLGLDVELASIAEPGVPEKAIESEARRLNLSWRRFELSRGLDVRGMQAVCEYAQNRAVSIIHSHGYKTNILLALVKRKGDRIRILTTLHGWIGKRGWGRSKLYQWVECALIPRMDCVVAVSNTMTQGTVFAWRLGHRLRVIHNGIDVSQTDESNHANCISRATIEIDRFAGNSPVFVVVGRLSPEKDITTALKAVAQVIGNGLDVKLVIIGEGPEKRRLVSTTLDLNLQQHVLFWGYCHCVRGILNKFSGLVISSLSEGVPLVVLEAMAAGVPVIASSVGGLPEVLVDGETGFIVEKARPCQFARALTILGKNSGLVSQLGLMARDHVKKEFSILSVANQYLSAYRAIM